MKVVFILGLLFLVGLHQEALGDKDALKNLKESLLLKTKSTEKTGVQENTFPHSAVYKLTRITADKYTVHGLDKGELKNEYQHGNSKVVPYRDIVMKNFQLARLLLQTRQNRLELAIGIAASQIESTICEAFREVIRRAIALRTVIGQAPCHNTLQPVAIHNAADWYLAMSKLFMLDDIMFNRDRSGSCIHYNSPLITVGDYKASYHTLNDYFIGKASECEITKYQTELFNAPTNGPHTILKASDFTNFPAGKEINLDNLDNRPILINRVKQLFLALNEGNLRMLNHLASRLNENGEKVALHNLPTGSLRWIFVELHQLKGDGIPGHAACRDHVKNYTKHGLLDWDIIKEKIEWASLPEFKPFTAKKTLWGPRLGWILVARLNDLSGYIKDGKDVVSKLDDMTKYLEGASVSDVPALELPWGNYAVRKFRGGGTSTKYNPYRLHTHFLGPPSVMEGLYLSGQFDKKGKLPVENLDDGMTWGVGGIFWRWPNLDELKKEQIPSNLLAMLLGFDNIRELFDSEKTKLKLHSCSPPPNNPAPRTVSKCFLDENWGKSCCGFLATTETNALNFVAGPSGTTDELMHLAEFFGAEFDCFLSTHFLLGAIAGMVPYFHHSYHEIKLGAAPVNFGVQRKYSLPMLTRGNDFDWSFAGKNKDDYSAAKFRQYNEYDPNRPYEQILKGKFPPATCYQRHTASVVIRLDNNKADYYKFTHVPPPIDLDHNYKKQADSLKYHQTSLLKGAIRDKLSNQQHPFKEVVKAAYEVISEKSKSYSWTIDFEPHISSYYEPKLHAKVFANIFCSDDTIGSEYHSLICPGGGGNPSTQADPGVKDAQHIVQEADEIEAECVRLRKLGVKGPCEKGTLDQLIAEQSYYIAPELPPDPVVQQPQRGYLGRAYDGVVNFGSQVFNVLDYLSY